MLKVPKLYAILDISCFADSAALLNAAEQLVLAGVTLMQYRNKTGSAHNILREARELKASVGTRAKLIMNDRADLCLVAGFDGVHVGQDDLSPDSARKIVGPDLWLGVSTHNPGQLTDADRTSADYVAVGPVFSTSSKANPDPVIGIGGGPKARKLTSKPLVAIGGITRQNCRQVIEAGADSVAVIRDLATSPRKSAEEFFGILR